MSFGSSQSINFEFTTTRDRAFHCKLESICKYIDSFGDNWSRLNLNFLPDQGYPAIKFRLKHPSGETGFDIVDTPNQIYSNFLRNAYILSDQDSLLVPLSGCTMLDTRVFEMRGSIDPVITFNNPDPSLKAFLKEANVIDGGVNIEHIAKCINMCDAISVWSMAYGTNPVTLTRNSSQFISSLRFLLKQSEVELAEVEDESMLPEW